MKINSVKKINLNGHKSYSKTVKIGKPTNYKYSYSKKKRANDYPTDITSTIEKINNESYDEVKKQNTSSSSNTNQSTNDFVGIRNDLYNIDNFKTNTTNTEVKEQNTLNTEVEEKNTSSSSNTNQSANIFLDIENSLYNIYNFKTNTTNNPTDNTTELESKNAKQPTSNLIDIISNDNLYNLNNINDTLKNITSYNENIPIKTTTSKINSLSDLDISKYNITKENVLSEVSNDNEYVITLKDGKILKYIDDELDKPILSEISIKNSNGKIASITKYDSSGKQNYQQTNTYNKDGEITSIEIVDNINNELSKTSYFDGKKRINKYRLSDNKPLSQTDFDEKGIEAYKETYYYDNSGNKIASVCKNAKNNETSTNYYIDNEVCSFPFDMIKSNDNFGIDKFDNLFDYSDTARLSESITDLLSPQEISNINDTINQNVDAAGRGTGKGVVAAAVTLITELKKHGIIIPYYWGGGHRNCHAGINTNWGNYGCAGSGNTRYTEGLDCTGFIMWAMKSAGINYDGTNVFAERNGTKITNYDQIKPGTILANTEHDILVIDTYSDDNGITHLICAESNGSGASEAGAGRNGDSYGGVIITDVTDTSAYDMYDMESFYNKYYENN